jgi:PEP-CTERM motif-containing protein
MLLNLCSSLKQTSALRMREGVPMKNLRWAIVVLLAVSVQQAYADSFNISRVTISFGANTSSGDNSEFAFAGPGTSIVGGGSACGGSDGWCIGAFLPPGTSVTPNVGLVSFEGFSIFKLGGHSYDMSEGAFLNSSITAGASFTVPMGKNSPLTFTVTIPANLTPPVGGVLPDGSQFNLNIPPGKLVLTFRFFPGVDGFPAGYYAFSEGQFIVATPEPGTIFLLATGLAAIVGRKCTSRRPSACR